jgi:hypothetical protein
MECFGVLRSNLQRGRAALMGTLRGSDWSDCTPMPELEPPHAAWCDTHRLYYRGPWCAKCREDAATLESRGAAERMRAEAESPQGVARAERMRRINRLGVEARAVDPAKRRGGIAGGRERALRLTPERRREIATIASRAAHEARRRRRMAEQSGGGKA